jgi:ATP-dependent Clp protease ATP-binding subunit ClpA
LIREGFDARFGARPLKRAIERLVANPLARILIEGEGRRSYHVRLEEGKLVFDSEET